MLLPEDLENMTMSKQTNKNETVINSRGWGGVEENKEMQS